jgi:Ca-activated chloride channel family protein
MAGLCSLSAAAQDTDVIRVETPLVSVPVVVTDRDGRYITDLTQKDFGILHDGARRPVDFFGTTDEPLTVAILIDTSHSTRPVLGDIKDAAKAFVKLLKPQDRAMIVTFDHDVTELCALTSDQEELKRAIKHAEIPDPIGTVLRDAVERTVFTTFAGIKGRKAIILLSDGRDGGSHITQLKLLSKLEETDTLIYSIQFRTEDRRLAEQVLRTGRFPRTRVGESDHQQTEQRRADAAADYMQKLSKVTAGRFFSTESGKLRETFVTVLDELRRQYRLGFYPPDDLTDDGKFHEIRVMVMRANLIVRARAGYRLTSAGTK